MGNQLLNSNLLRRLIAEQHLVDPWSRLAYRDKAIRDIFMGKDYYKPGDTIDISLPEYYNVTEGLTVTKQPIVDAKYPVTIKGPYNVAVDLNSIEQQRQLRSVKDQYINPATMALGGKLATITAGEAINQIVHFVNYGDSYMDGFPAVTEMEKKFAEYDVPDFYKRYFGISLNNYQKILTNVNIYNSFNKGLNEKVLRQYYIGELALFDVFKTRTIGSHTSGTHASSGDVIVKTAVGSGGSIVLTGYTPGATVKASDHGDFDGIKEYDNILNRTSTNGLQFKVSAPNTELPIGPDNDTYTADANGDVSINIEVIDNRPLTASGPRQNFVSGNDPNVIPSGTVINWAQKNKTCAVNVAFTDHGLIRVNPPMEELLSKVNKSYTDEKYMISLRYSADGNINDSANVHRLDTQLAVRWVPRQSFLYFTPI